MNKTELIAAVAEKTGLSKKDTEAAVNATLLTITETLKAEEKVQLVGFGSFETKKRAARTGLNPRTKETVEIPASKVPAFKAGKALKDAVAKSADVCKGWCGDTPAFLIGGTPCVWTNI